MHPTQLIVLTRLWDGQKQKIVTLSPSPPASRLCPILSQTLGWHLRSPHCPAATPTTFQKTLAALPHASRPRRASHLR